MANINAYVIKWGNLTILNRYLRICHMKGREMISRANCLMSLNNLNVERMGIYIHNVKMTKSEFFSIILIYAVTRLCAKYKKYYVLNREVM